LGQAIRTKRPRGGHLERFSAFVEKGWLSVLKPLEIKLWVAWEKFADNETGVAYPSAALLAPLVGTSEGHIGPARARLVELGLFEIVEAGGGRGRAWKIRVLVPPEPAEQAAAKGSRLREPLESGPEAAEVPAKTRSVAAENGDKGSRKVPDSEEKGSRFEGEKVPDFEPKGSRFEGANKDELLRNYPQELPKELAGAGEGRSGGGTELSIGDWLDPLKPLVAEVDRGPVGAGGEQIGGGEPDDENDPRYAALVEDWMLCSIAAHLRSPPFYVKLGQWLDHLAQKRANLSTLAFRRQMGRLNRLTLNDASAVIEESIGRNWQSLVDPERMGGKGSHGTSRTKNHETHGAGGHRPEPVGTISAIAKRRTGA
jgi:hypothetical protein